ncbi:YrdB family protein [Streptomyces fuscigenes]|nr:YrdB family protein [Streptomyces fuscigenes]
MELAAFAALCWWGLHVGGPLPAVAVTLAAIVVWGLFAAPRARFRVPAGAVLAVKALVLGGGALALWPVGHPVWAIVLGAVVVVNTGLAQVSRRTLPAPAVPASADPGTGDGPRGTAA